VTMAIIAFAMFTIPEHDRIEIANRHLDYCEQYRFVPGDHSWSLVSVWIGKRYISSGYHAEMRPVIATLTNAWNGVRA